MFAQETTYLRVAGIRMTDLGTKCVTSFQNKCINSGTALADAVSYAVMTIVESAS